MPDIKIEVLKPKWNKVLEMFEEKFDEKPDLQTLLFLIGVQELGKGPQKFTKDQKMDLSHIAICRLLSKYGFYEFERLDSEGWPHYKVKNDIPPLTLQQQDMLLKQAVVDYFEENA